MGAFGKQQTAYLLPPRRTPRDRGHGQAAILPHYEAHLVHDRYASYFKYGQVERSLCNAHLLRELKYLHEQEGCAWAVDIMDLLPGAKQHKEQNPSVSKHYMARIENEFEKLVQAQLKEEEKAMASLTGPVCRGKPKRIAHDQNQAKGVRVFPQ